MNCLGKLALALVSAQRLHSDSKLLADHGRGLSSIALAVFAIEEFGKGLIWEWCVQNLASKREYPTHIEKQTALFILLHAAELMTPDGRRLFASCAEREKLDLRVLGPFSEQFAMARSGFYNDLRMVSTYADQQPKWVEMPTAQESLGIAKELHQFFENALMASESPEAMHLASQIYENGLGRL